MVQLPSLLAPPLFGLLQSPSLPIVSNTEATRHWLLSNFAWVDLTVYIIRL